MARFVLAQLILSVAVMGSPKLVVAQKAADKPQVKDNPAHSSHATIDDEKKQQDGWLLRFLFEMGAKPNSLDYVLREIDLTDQQRKKLVHSTGEFLKNYRKKNEAVDRLVNRSYTEPSKQLQSDIAAATAARDSILKTQVKQVRAELLEHQVDRLIQIVKQRIYNIAHDVEPFETPLLATDLKLKPDQQTRLKAIVAEQKSLFLIDKQKLRQESWQKILKELPVELQDETALLIDPDDKLGLGKTGAKK